MTQHEIEREGEVGRGSGRGGGGGRGRGGEERGESYYREREASYIEKNRKTQAVIIQNSKNTGKDEGVERYTHVE